MIPPARETPKEETIPSIAHAGAVKPVSGFSEPIAESRSLEPAPAIPNGPETSAAVTFSNPSVASATPRSAVPDVSSNNASSNNVGNETGRRSPYSPPAFGGAAPNNVVSNSVVPAVMPSSVETTSAPNTNAPLPASATSAFTTPTAMKPRSDEPSPGIPGDSVPAAATFATPVTPLLPQHEELAKTETPLGSQLQNQLQELRGQQVETPRIRFASAHTEENLPPTTGAVKFDPAKAREAQPNLLPMPTDTNAATGLSMLLPSGSLPEENSVESVDESLLPALNTAPQAVMASAGPRYGRIGSRESRRPADATLDRGSTDRVVDREQRAVSFQQRLDSEIKRSPTETEQYVIQEGDNYMTICDRVFGTSLLFRALAEHNRQKFGVAYKPEPGTVIEIPPADYLRSNYGGSSQRGRRNTGGQTSAALENNPLSSTTNRQGIRYVAQEGDTVFSIATDKLKDTPLWREILAMNSDKVRDPKSPIPAGMEILLPVNSTAQNSSVRR